MITFDRLLNNSMSYFPLVLCVFSWLKCILLLHQNFGKLNLWMQIPFIILFMIDLYKDNHVRACVCAFVNFFFKKTSPQKLLTGLLPNFIVVFLRKRLKSSLHCNRKIRPVERYRRSSASSVRFSSAVLEHEVEVLS